jgi:predicted KAP-like P-loop ATPase
MAAMQVTLENIAPSKMLNYVQKQTSSHQRNMLKSNIDYGNNWTNQKNYTEGHEAASRNFSAVHPITAQSLNRSRSVQQIPADCKEWTTAKRRQSERL